MSIDIRIGFVGNTPPTEELLNFLENNVIPSLLNGVEANVVEAETISLQTHQPNSVKKATAEEIEQLDKKKEEHKGDTPSDCTICLEKIKKRQRKIKLQCGHEFHSKCIRASLTKTNRNCPTCRACVFT